MNVDLFLKRVVFLAKHFGNYDIKDIVKLCLLDINMSTDVDGYKYLIFGIDYMYKNPNAMLTKHVYPAIAREFGCQKTQVEAAIRRLLKETWRFRGETWLYYFPDNRKLTTGEFMNTMTEVIAFWDTCRKNLAAEGVDGRG